MPMARTSAVEPVLCSHDASGAEASVSRMKWAIPRWLGWLAVAYFAAGQVYVWVVFLTITPGTSRTVPEIALPAVLEIILALLIASYVILRIKSLVWVILATTNAIVLLVLNFSTWYASIGTTANWAPKLTRLDGLAVTLVTLTTAGARGRGVAAGGRELAAQEAIDGAAESAAFLEQEGVCSREDEEVRAADPGGDPPQVDQRYHRVRPPASGQGRQTDPGQLTVVEIAAQPRVLCRHLSTRGRGRHPEVIRYLARLAGPVQASEEPAALGLMLGRIQLLQDLLIGWMWLAVDGLSLRGSEDRRVATRVRAGQDQVRHPQRVANGQALGDEAPHRPAQHIGTADADRRHERGRGVGQGIE